MKPELLKGNLDMLLLAALADAPAHGYAIIVRLRQLSDAVFDLPEGTVYPALHRLERQGLLVSEWSTGGSSRRRRVYAITADGRAALLVYRQDWRRFADAVQLVIREAS